jgi:hypothetical protein
VAALDSEAFVHRTAKTLITPSSTPQSTSSGLLRTSEFDWFEQSEAISHFAETSTPGRAYLSHIHDRRPCIYPFFFIFDPSTSSHVNLFARGFLFVAFAMPEGAPWRRDEWT